MASGFSTYFASLLEKRGAAAELSRDSGVPTSHISRIASGEIVPSPETLAQLIGPFSALERAQLVIGYLELHRPANAEMVRIVVADADDGKDRLDKATQYLDPQTREALANIVEAVNRSPEEGSKAIRALGAWYGSILSHENIIKLPVKYTDTLPKDNKVAEQGERK